uniref:Ankyrin repeat domain-containing protein 10-like n=1 Tax=Saccoglossus kowalevskii TaxID=10224 RepID=A0ABM0MFL5_SACKO|nr:PREDICTED: ankyrin repeat domain-containing protein 10-like [Saccoglossus kowalevskii]
MEESYAFGYWGAASEETLRRDYPVHRACRDGDSEGLSLLITNGQHSGLYVEDQFYGWTPAHWAAYFGKDYLGETPVHKAARSGTVECLGILHAHCAQINITNNNGHTPSQLAVSCGNQHCCVFLQQCSQKMPSSVNGFHQNGFHANGTQYKPNGHTTCAHSSLPRRKRGFTEEDNLCQLKRARTEGVFTGLSVAEPHGIPVEAYHGIPLNNNSSKDYNFFHSQNTLNRVFNKNTNVELSTGDEEMEVSSPTVVNENISNSFVEHERTVHVQQGYDSTLCDALLIDEQSCDRSTHAIK